MRTEYYTYKSYHYSAARRNKRRNDNLEQLAQALFNHYFIEHLDLLGDYKIGKF